MFGKVYVYKAIGCIHGETVLAHQEGRQMDMANCKCLCRQRKDDYRIQLSTGGRMMVGSWITCVHCGTETLTATALSKASCCFSCYMKGKGPGNLEAEE